VLLLPLGAWLAARTLHLVSGQVRSSGPSRRSIVTLALAGARRTSPGHNVYQRMVLASWMAAVTAVFTYCPRRSCTTRVPV